MCVQASCLADQCSNVRAGELIGRFKEREENVKADVFAAFTALMRQVGTVAKRYPPGDPAR